LMPGMNLAKAESACHGGRSIPPSAECRFRDWQRAGRADPTRPIAGSACEIKNDIPGDHGRYTDSEDEVEMQVSIGRDGARGQDGERGGQRKADGLGEANYRQEQIAVMRNR